MKQKKQHFVIVGGGTAGWLSALILKLYASNNELPIDITVVESSQIPTIGVGEGTTAVFRQMLLQLGFDETDFVRETGATIKLGIRHKDWRLIGEHYDGPIDDPNLVSQTPSLSPESQASALDIYAVANGRTVADAHLFGQLMQRDKSPFALKLNGSLIPAGPYHHAYHFDQAKVGAWLRSKAVGIELVDAQIVDVRRDAQSGWIDALIADDETNIGGDFFIDCTGFRRKLIAETMGAKWVSYADALPVNRAMPFWLEHDKEVELAPYTLAWAQQAGWMWSIPTQDRVGCGYVYCDRYRTPDQAQAEIETALGRKIDPRNDLKFDIGRIDNAWIGNCLALGLSSSFLEPLEATSIHGTVVQLMLFTGMYLNDALSPNPVARDTYNSTVARQVDDFRDFINLHYVSERKEPFWQDVQKNFLSSATRHRISQWRQKMPTSSDFAPFPGNLPHIEEQLHYPVLDGLRLLNRTAAKRHLAEVPKARAHARKSVESLTKEYRAATNKCLGHWEYLEHLRQS